MIGLCLGAAFGYWPWLEIQASIGDHQIAHAGMILQIGFALFCLALLLFLPSHARIMQLEKSHRDFQITMQDVAKAYAISHQADRDGLFHLRSEFDSVRERIQHLRDHPSLELLEPAVLEVAAQMSHEARKLADVYNSEKVKRAKTFLKQRQQEVDRFEEKLKVAQHTTDELKNWLLQIETDETLIERQLDTLEADLFEILPELGFDLEYEQPARRNEKVVPMTAKQVKPVKPVKPVRPAKPAK
ncbi:MAG: DNA repair protein [Rhodobacterales bacterium]|nr:MAG: DNA repair protein [Rhodobacterales bacterium]